MGREGGGGDEGGQRRAGGLGGRWRGEACAPAASHSGARPDPASDQRGNLPPDLQAGALLGTHTGLQADGRRAARPCDCTPRHQRRQRSLALLAQPNNEEKPLLCGIEAISLLHGVLLRGWGAWRRGKRADCCQPGTRRAAYAGFVVFRGRALSTWAGVSADSTQLDPARHHGRPVGQRQGWLMFEVRLVSGRPPFTPPQTTPHPLASLVICADGGANRVHEAAPRWVQGGDADAARRQFVPAAVVGDLDSLRADVREFYEGLGTRSEGCRCLDGL